MRILFDQGTPVPLRRFLHPHIVDTAAERGWSTLRIGELLKQAESEGNDAFLTTDSNLKYQQNLTNRALRILVLTTTSWPRISKRVNQVRDALEALEQGGYTDVLI